MQLKTVFGYAAGAFCVLFGSMAVTAGVIDCFHRGSSCHLLEVSSDASSKSGPRVTSCCTVAHTTEFLNSQALVGPVYCGQTSQLSVCLLLMLSEVMFDCWPSAASRDMPACLCDAAGLLLQ